MDEAAPEQEPRRGERRRGIWYGLLLALIALLILLFLMQCSRAKDPDVNGVVVKPPKTEVDITLPTPAPADDLPLPDTTGTAGTGTQSDTGDKSAVKPVNMAPVPDVVGMTKSEAESTIKASGFRPWPIPRPSPQVRNIVGQQWPVAGEKLELGQDVYFIYGGGAP